MQKKLFSKILIFQWIAAMILCSGIGCRQPNPEGREDVSGTVTLNGKAIDPKWYATISFVPGDGRDVTEGGGGQITGGKYLLTGIGGIKPGHYKVRIFINQLYDIRTGEPSTPETGDFDSVRVNMIPADFNDDTILEFEVIQGKRNTFHYNVVTDYIPDVDAVIRSVINRQRNTRSPAGLLEI